MIKRIEYLDYLRGIAIIFVVMGHLIQYNLKGESATQCFNFIYSFHMGFFFFISGCVASLLSDNNKHHNALIFIRKKAVQLLLPFFVWGGVNSLAFAGGSIYALPRHMLLIIKYPDYSLWFLLFLFFMQVVYFFCCLVSFYFKRKEILNFILLIAVVAVSLLRMLKDYLLPSGYTWITEDYFLLFCIGHVVQSSELKNKMGKPVIFICLIMFLLISSKFDFYQGGMLTMRLIKILSSIFFSLFAFYFVKTNCILLSTKSKELLNLIGTHTLEIYATHFFIVIVFQLECLEVSNINVAPLFLVVFITAILVCCLVIRLADFLKKIPYMSLLLYGKN